MTWAEKAPGRSSTTISSPFTASKLHTEGGGRGQGVLPDRVGLQVGQRFRERSGQGILGQRDGLRVPSTRRAAVQVVGELGPGRDGAAAGRPGPPRRVASSSPRRQMTRISTCRESIRCTWSGQETELGGQPAAEQMAGTDLARDLHPLERPGATAGG